MNIPENEKTDAMAKLKKTLLKIKKLFTFFDIINNEIVLKILEKWKNQWKNTISKNFTYFTFNTSPGQRNIKTLSKLIKNKLLYFTIMQLKIEHEYFKSFQFKLSNWTQSFRIENDLCFKCQT